MRLIDTETGEFETFVDLSTAPPYAILSHTWDQDGEQTYQEVVKVQEKYKTSAAASCSPLKAYDTIPPTSSLFVSPSYPSSQAMAPALEIPLLASPMFKLLRSLLLWILAQEFLRILLRSLRPTRPSIWDPDSGLSEKVRNACKVARLDGYRYMWVDSSCIDKTSSSELSEAINSMFNWYRDAQVCYAFLADVPSDEDVKLEASRFRNRPAAPFFAQDDRERARSSRFRNSRWFKRAWTLQELIAPRVVIFLSKDWKPLGTKGPLADLVEDITHIDRGILTHKTRLADESVAERMRWASERQATLVEDEAYSLLGIFGITMPTLYGEGRYAFQRLQEEILQRIPDQSLFAWGSESERVTISIPIPNADRRHQEEDTLHIENTRGSPFASSPHSFSFSEGRVVRASRQDFDALQLPVPEYTPTPYGMRTQLSLLPWQAVRSSTLQYRIDGNGTLFLAVFGCKSSREESRLFTKLCYVAPGETSTAESLLHVLLIPASPDDPYHPLLPVSLEALIRARTIKHLQARTVYLPRPESFMPNRRLHRWESGPKGSRAATLGVSLSTLAQADADLELHGYRIVSKCFWRTKDLPGSYSFALFKAPTIGIYIQYRLSESNATIAIEARSWILPYHPDGNFQDDVVHRAAPYISAIWVDRAPWTINLPPRRIHVVTASGDQVTLRLHLCVASPSHYHTHVEVVTDAAGTDDLEYSTRTLLQRRRAGSLQAGRLTPHNVVKFTMLGSVQQRLEKRGYSVNFEASVTDMGSIHTLSICNADAGFIVSIKYFHMLRIREKDMGHELIVAAHILLESSVPSEGASDGPYVVLWDDSDVAHWGEKGWKWSHEQAGVPLITPAGHALTLRLGLDLAWELEYYLCIDIEHGEDFSLRRGLPHGAGKQDTYHLLRPHEYHTGISLKLGEPHPSINFILPSDLERALRKQGYCQVDFERSSEGHPDHSLLTLSDTNLTFTIKYFHNLSPGLDENEGLTFKAYVQIISPQSVQDDATPADGQMVEWHASQLRSQEGWNWNLPVRHIFLTARTGLNLDLRLSFELVWLGEYFIMVEPVVTFPPQQPQTEPGIFEPFDASRPHENDADETGDHDGMQTTAISNTDNQELVNSIAIGLEALPFWGVEDVDV